MGENSSNPVTLAPALSCAWIGLITYTSAEPIQRFDGTKPMFLLSRIEI
jgi:hypothetical protein